MKAEPQRNVCLVDFQQQSQLNPAIPMGNIVGIIDHHALQSNTIVTEKPIFVDIRPWGCMSSIIAHNFAVQQRFLPKRIAGMLLSAVLSDTLNLRSPTTTPWDERVVAMLVQYLVSAPNTRRFCPSTLRSFNARWNPQRSVRKSARAPTGFPIFFKTCSQKKTKKHGAAKYSTAGISKQFCALTTRASPMSTSSPRVSFEPRATPCR